MNFIKISVLLIGVIIISCDAPLNESKKSTKSSTKKEKKVKNGEVVSHHSNGNVSSIINYKDGKKHGLAKSFYQDGKPMREVTYSEGIKDGVARTYYDNGKLKLETQYVKNKKEGLRKRYYDFGYISSEQMFKNDCPSAELTEYSKRGKKRTKYPELKIIISDNVAANGNYKAEIFFEKNTSRSNYYIGELVEGKFLDISKLERLPEANHKGIIEIQLAPGQYIMEKMNIIGVQNTLKKNQYIVQKTLNLAIERPY